MTPGCKFCNKHGMPVVLTRYAVAPSSANTPALPINMAPSVGTASSTDGPVAPDMHGVGKYTIRLLRETGYLYQFDELTSAWIVYKVTNENAMYRLSLDPFNPDPADPKQADNPKAFEYKCGPGADIGFAMIVTIPNPEKATTVWFSYADTLWTKDVFKKHMSDSYRKTHMTRFDAAAWRANQYGVPHAVPLASLDALVPECLLDEKKIKSAFCWDSAFNYVQPYSTKDVKAVAYEYMRDKTYPPALIALHDPVGIMQDLSTLMDRFLAAFNNNDKERRRGLYVSNAIDNIKSSILYKTASDELSAARDLTESTTADMGLYAMTESGQKQINAIANVTREDLKRAINEKWSKYEERFEKNKKHAFDTKYADELKLFVARTITPLSKAHAIWLQAHITINYFDKNHDSANLKSGMEYAQAFLNSIAGTQDKFEITKILMKQLNMEPDEKGAIAINALMFNQEEFRKSVKEATREKVELWHIPWSALTDAYKSAYGVLEKHDATWANRISEALVMHLSAPIVKMMDLVVLKACKFTLPAVLGMISQAPMVEVELSGTFEQFCEHASRQLYLMAKGPNTKLSGFNRARMTQAVKDDIKLLKLQGLPTSTNKTYKFILLVDEEALKALKFDSKTPIADRAKLVMSHVKTPQQLEEVNIMRSFESFRIGVPQIGITCVSMILQIGIVAKLKDDIAGAMEEDFVEAIVRFGAGILGFVGFIGEAFETAGETLVKRAEKGVGELAESAKIFGEKMRARGRFYGKNFGGAAGTILALADLYESYESFRHQEYGLSALYFVSAASGFATTCAFAMALVVPFWGWIALVILVVVSFLIELFHEDNILKWLSRCKWGISHVSWGKPEPIYESENDEIHDLNIALAG